MFKPNDVAKSVLLEKGIVQEGEEFSTVLKRIARNIASVEAPDKKDYWSQKFFELMDSNYFLPNYPTLRNGSREDGQILANLSGCFVLEVNDSRESIFNTLRDAVEVQAMGGGTGFNFSNLRQKGAIINSTKGASSGPISFMRVYDLALGDIIKQSSVRPGASMAILWYWHPDILEFITVKENRDLLKNFNLSVMVDDYFMECAKNEENIQLKAPHTGEIVGEINAAILLDKIADNAARNGCPGLLFYNNLNKNNPLQIPITATNPCGETGLYFKESCVLGSLNLKQLELDGKLDEGFEDIVETAVRYLDNIVDLNYYPLPGMKEIGKKYRKIGLGVMGIADILFMKRLSYNSEEGRDYIASIMDKFQKANIKASEKLAIEKGSFEDFENSKFTTPRRNSYISVQAPTGTLSIIAGCSAGIEPLFSLIQYVKTSKAKNRYKIIDPTLQALLKRKKLWDDDLVNQIEKNKGSIQGIKSIPKDIQEVFVTALDISYEDHVRMQAIIQKYIENSVSKTINMHETATAEDAKNAMILAHNLGCKGITIYRDGSKTDQPIKYTSDTTQKIVILKKKRPKILQGQSEKIELGLCGSLLVNINYTDDGQICEVVTSKGSSGSCTNAQVEGQCRIISIALRGGVSVEEIVHQLEGIKCDNTCWDTAENADKPDKITSCQSAIAVAIKRFIQRKGMPEIKTSPTASKCPKCGEILIKEGDCDYCTCGFTHC